MMHTPHSETPHAVSRRNLQRRFWALATLATLTPVAVLSGCNGSGTDGGPGTINLPSGSATPTFTPTLTPTTAGTAFNGRITLDGGRQGFLALNLLPGNNAEGTFSVSDSPTPMNAKPADIAPRSTLPLPRAGSIPAGTYSLSSLSFDALSRTLLLRAPIPASTQFPGSFDIIVQFTTTGVPSSFIVSSNGRNYFGSISAPNPTPNPT